MVQTWGPSPDEDDLDHENTTIETDNGKDPCDQYQRMDRLKKGTI